MLTAGAQGWPLSAFPRDAMVAALSDDGYDAAVVSHCLHMFGAAEDAPAGAPAALDARAVCIARARALLLEQHRWRWDDFEAAWRAAAPEARAASARHAACMPRPHADALMCAPWGVQGMAPSEEWLRGEALFEVQGACAMLARHPRASWLHTS